MQNITTDASVVKKLPGNCCYKWLGYGTLQSSGITCKEKVAGAKSLHKQQSGCSENQTRHVNFSALLSLVLVEQQGEEFESAMLTTLQNNVPNKVTLSRYMVYIRLTVAFVRRNTSYTTEKKN